MWTQTQKCLHNPGEAQDPKDEFTNQTYKTFEEIWLHEIVGI